MASNNLTPEQDLLTREFYTQVAMKNDLFPSDPVGQRNLMACLIRLLGYVVVDNKFVDPAKVKNLKRSIGSPSNVVDEWHTDTQKLIEALEEKEFNEATNSNSSNKADSGESSKDSEIREAVLREDV